MSTKKSKNKDFVWAWMIVVLIVSLTVLCGVARLSKLQKERQPYPHEFAWNQIKAGDEIGGLKVKNVDQYKKTAKNQAISADNISILFTGERMVRGEYKIYPTNDPFVGGQICLQNLDVNSENLLPKFQDDPYRAWFCLNLTADQQKEFNAHGDNGLVELIINNYNLVSYPADGVDRADLVEILSITAK